MKTNAATGPAGSGASASAEPLLPFATDWKASAVGSRSSISSRSFSTPVSWLPLAVKRTGAIFRSWMAFLSAGFICSSLRLPCEKNVSMSLSSPSATSSTRRLVELGGVGGELVGDHARRGLAGVVREPALHRDEVDDAAEALLLADRGLDADAGAPELLLELVHDAAAVGALAVHAVHDDEAGEAELVAHLPGLLGLDLDARDGVDDDDRGVGGAQAAEHFRDEDAVARRVDQVDLLLLPLERRDGEADRDLPLDLLGVEVGRRVALLDAAEPRRGARLVEQRGDERRLADAVVPHDGDVVDGGRGVNLHEPSGSLCEGGRL